MKRTAMIFETPVGAFGVCFLEDGKQIYTPAIKDRKVFECHTEWKVGFTYHFTEFPEEYYTKITENIVWFKNKNTGERIAFYK